MSDRKHLISAVAVVALSAAASAADLAKIDRSVALQPAYRSKPKYCLLVFGPEAKTRVWLVQDGDALYVDRNGNRLLTDAGERITAKKTDDADEGTFSFQAGEIRDGNLTHKKLTVNVINLDYLADRDEQVKEFLAKNPKGRGYFIDLDVEIPDRKGAGIGGRVEQIAYYADVHGLLQFADRPQDAPIVHFGGPLQITLFGGQRLTAGRETDLILGVGTPGLGAGTTAFVAYEGLIPDNVHPTVEIVYPAAQHGQPPMRERHELKERC